MVAGVGTGGTITGVGEVLKARKPRVQVIAVEPDASPVLSGGPKGPHPIQGIGAGFIPDVLNTKIYDEIIRVKADDAFATARRWPPRKACWWASPPAQPPGRRCRWPPRPKTPGKLIVVIIPSFGERYLSTPCSPTWRTEAALAAMRRARDC